MNQKKIGGVQVISLCLSAIALAFALTGAIAAGTIGQPSTPTVVAFGGGGNTGN